MFHVVNGPPPVIDVVAALDPALVVKGGGALYPLPGMEEKGEL